MSESSTYDQDRLRALWDRVDALDGVLESVAVILTTQQPAEAVPAALAVLNEGIMQGFADALLCSRDSTDEHLDTWLGAPAAATGGGAS